MTGAGTTGAAVATAALAAALAAAAGAASVAGDRASKSKARGRTDHRIVTGRGVLFAVPAGAALGRFQPTDDGRLRYAVATRIAGLGRISVTVGPRGDPEATLANELSGAQAGARTRYFRKSRARTVRINRSLGCEALEAKEDGVEIAHCVTWSKDRQFDLSLESRPGGPDPLRHPAWRRLVESFRSTDAPLRAERTARAPPAPDR
jgi:hypothetical protein